MLAVLLHVFVGLLFFVIGMCAAGVIVSELRWRRAIRRQRNGARSGDSRITRRSNGSHAL
jgi:hypothetical protein